MHYNDTLSLAETENVTTGTETLFVLLSPDTTLKRMCLCPSLTLRKRAYPIVFRPPVLLLLPLKFLTK